MFKINNKYTRTYEHVSHLWAYFTTFSSVSIVDFEQGNLSWDFVHSLLVFCKDVTDCENHVELGKLK